MAEQAAQVIFKILSGLHTGAELELKNGTYILGSDADCDVVLTDSLLSPRHLKLNVKGLSVSLEPIEGPTYLSGKPLEGKVENVPLYSFITLGSTHLMLGEAGHPWPKVTAANAPDLMILAGIKSPAEEAVIAQAKAAKQAEKEITPVEPLIPFPLKVLFYSVTSLILTIVFTGLYMTIRENEENSSSVLQDNIYYLEANLLPYNAKNNLTIEAQNDHIVVSGYIGTLKELEAIKRIAKNSNFEIEVDIYCQEQLVEAVAKVLQYCNLNLNVSSGNNLGDITVSGFSFIKDKWLSAKAAIQLKIKGIKNITDQVIDGSRADQIIETVIAEKGLSSSLKINLKVDSIVVTGTVNQDVYGEWVKIKSTLNEKLLSSIPIEDDVNVITYANNDAPYFDFPIESINLEEPGWITFQNGQRYFEGTLLANGYTIKKISQEGIILTQGNNEIIINLEFL